MSTFIDRLKIERKELDEKIVKLDNFLTSDLEQPITEEMYKLLRKQLSVMLNYLAILDLRLEILEEEE